MDYSELPITAEIEDQPIEHIDIEAENHKSLLSQILEGVKALFASKPNIEFNAPTGFKLIGDQYWLAYYSNSYLDRDKEHFSFESLQNDIDFMNETKSYPELWRYHVKGTRHGVGICAFMAGKFAAVVGKFDNTPIANIFKKYYQANPDQALSHGFFYFEKEGNVYKSHHSFEVTTLDLDVAANPYTVFGSFSEVKMSDATEKQIADLRAILGDQMVDSILTNGMKATEKLDSEGVAFKAANAKFPPDEDETDESEDEEKEPKEDKAFNAQFDLVANALQTMAKSIGDLVGVINTSNQRLAVVEQHIQTEQEQKSKATNVTPLHDARKQALIAEMETNINASSLEARQKISQLSPAEGLLASFDLANQKRQK